MISSTFIFDKKQFDEEFYILDKVISEVAKQATGYLGEESWENSETGRIANVYYWESMDALQTLMQHPKHLEAKSKQAKWLNGYQVVIAEVIRTYSDEKFFHPAQRLKKV
ncbi:MAG: antibiotic biosynthesis monooxygenase family protein [Methylophilaceae bacterium]